MRRSLFALFTLALALSFIISPLCAYADRGGKGRGKGGGHGGGHGGGGHGNSGDNGSAEDNRDRQVVQSARNTYLNSLNAVEDLTGNIEELVAGAAVEVELRKPRAQLEAARRAAVASAQAYLAAEGNYKSQHGNYVYSSTVEEANDMLAYAEAQESRQGYGGEDGGDLDDNGIPKVDRGRMVSNNTEYSGEAAEAVANQEGYGTGATFSGDADGAQAGNRAFYDPASENAMPLLAKGPAGMNGGRVFANREAMSEAAAARAREAVSRLNAASAGRAAGGLFSGGAGADGGRPAGQSEALRQAQNELYFGNYPNTVRQADKAIAADADDREAWQVKADALNRMGDYKGAEESARRAIALAPEQSAGYEALTLALLHQKRYDEALAAAQRAVAVAPNSADAHALLAFAYEKLGNREAMLNALAEAAALDARYNAHLEAAQRGETLFDPDAKDSWRRVYEDAKGGGTLPGRGLPWTLIGLGGLAAAAGLLGAAAWRRKRAAAAAAPAAEAVDGDLLAGKYRLERVIGRGGMGQVWQGVDVSLGRPVAVKQWIIDVRLQEAARKLYLNEAHTLARVHHPHIVDIFAVLDRPDGIYLVFEMVEGKTVEHMIVEQKRLPFAQAARIIGTAAQALHFAHRHGVVHRDMKPSNIMLTAQGLVKVMDFGIARAAGAAEVDAPGASGPALSTRTRTIAGTPEYMAPEAAQGLVSPALDVYALGVTFYEMLTGRLPFTGPDQAYVPLDQQLPDVPPDLENLVRACLQADPAARPAGAEDFAHRLAAIGEPAKSV